MAKDFRDARTEFELRKGRQRGSPLGEVWAGPVPRTREITKQQDFQHSLIANLQTRVANLETAIDAQRSLVPLDVYTEVPEKDSEQNIHGGIEHMYGPVTINVGLPGLFSKRIGKFFVQVDILTTSGVLKITGTKVDRDTGVTTVGFVERITIDTVSTDASGVDAGGNPVHDFEDVYMTANWYTGTINLVAEGGLVMSATFYHISFEQFNDCLDMELQTFDTNALCTSSGGTLYAHCYYIDVDPDTNRAEIKELAEVFVASGSGGMWERLRRGVLGKELYGKNDGMWVDVFLGPGGAPRWEQITMKVWALVKYDGAPEIGDQSGSVPKAPGGGGVIPPPHEPT